MKFSYLLLLAAGVSLLASAQTEQSMPAAANANAPVTPLKYQSVFADYVAAKEAAQSPDKGWVHANRTLLGANAEASTSTGQSNIEASSSTSKAEPVHNNNEHKGAHR